MRKKMKSIPAGFWTSPRTEAFTAADRFLYLYLLTNPHGNLCSCYEISLRTIAHETGLNLPVVREGMQRLDKIHAAIAYDDVTKTVLITNGLRQAYTSSPKVEKRIRTEIGRVRNHMFRVYLRAELHRLHDSSVQARIRGVRPAFRLPPFEP